MKRRFLTRGSICLAAVLAVTFVLGGSNIDVTRAETAFDSQRLSQTKPGEGWEWTLDYMDVPEAWNLIDEIKPRQMRKESDKIIVATLDTGIDTSHPDLQANLNKEHCVSVAGKTAPYPTYQTPKFPHGTKTAGIIAATSGNGKGISGVAAGNDNDLISLMGVNVFQDKQYTAQSNASTKDIIKGLNYACDHGARVINMCLGHSPGAKDLSGKKHNDKALEKAINDAVYNKNVVIVCSAGNHNNEKTWYPSDFDATISVISTQKYKNAWSRHTKAPSSNYGKKKDLSAPGDAIYTTTLGGAYVSGSGTSYAAPSVAAVAALMLYVNPNLKAREVKEILCSTATDLYTRGSDRYTGSGNVNAYRAVAAAAGRRIQTNAEALPQPEAKAQSDGRHTIKVSWDRIPQANGYWIYRAAEKNGHYKRIKQIRKGDQRYFLDPKRKFNKNYFYKVKAYGTTEDGKKMVSDFSSAAAAKARGSGKVAALKCKTINYKTIALSWKQTKNADGYVVYRKTANQGAYKPVKTISKNTTTKWRNSKLRPGKTYSYKVCSYRVVSGKRYYGEASEIKTGTARPARPAVTISKKGASITLKWKKVPQASGYKIYRSQGSSSKWKQVHKKGANGRTYVNKGLIKGRKYRYKVVAYKRIHGKTVYSAYSAIKAKRI
ncbi:S8 family serine peptidase [Ihubacter massiliensis]|uniref:S8 family serine peptidase n=1 Tax=Hominibacterium faecale TaxID=2839743 RepID=A0A9J6QMQ6_9FIRM|nr:MULTISPECIES: S8 family serine peptidase [Eubacteriales Family XIII. Incertae Sedis]MCC2864700.1 S8 family serine peptidase [Anaerovorax odorimutans]MCO7123786.1 S8 family serine peptidase [Ihubacter massiliensis]MCU7378712.1 S8 family serine peptidase [Hominibacterium faecale]